MDNFYLSLPPFIFFPVYEQNDECIVAIPSFPADKPSGFVMPVLFFRLCFLRLACGDGGGSSLGLVALPTVEPAGSLIPLAERTERKQCILIPNSFVAKFFIC